MLKYSFPIWGIRTAYTGLACRNWISALHFGAGPHTARSAVPQHRGRKRQLAIAGFANLDIAPEITPALTTVHVSSQQIGEKAAQMLRSDWLSRQEWKAA